jgi:uncharacterized protein
MKMRQEADYYPEVPFTSEEAVEAIQMAADFLERAKTFVR